MQDQQFKNKVVLITGGGSGIGQATALAFARQGAKVAVCDISPASVQAAQTLLQAEGGEALGVVANTSISADVSGFVDKVLAAYGRIDIAVNCAGISPPQSLTADVEEADFDRVVAVNLKGVWQSMRYEIPPMLAQGAGVIINIASVLGLVGLAYSAPYVATKHGVVGLTKTAALEYSARGVRVNAVCPAVIKTPMTIKGLENPELLKIILQGQPIGRVGAVEDVISAIFWLASDGAGFVTGAAIAVDGGRTAQ